MHPVTLLGGLLKLVLGFLWTSSHAPVPIADFALKTFAVINLSSKND